MPIKPKSKTLSKQARTHLLTPEERLELHMQAEARRVSESWLVAEFIRKGLMGSGTHFAR